MKRLVFLPGLACDAELFAPQLAHLAGVAGVQAVVSDVHTRAPTLPAMAQALLAEQEGPLWLCGASMGGMVALHAACQQPQRVAGLLLLGTTARADMPELIALRTQAIAEFEAGRVREVLQANVPFAFHPRNQADAALVGRYMAMIERAGTPQLIAQNRAVMARPDLRGELHRITCPTVMVCGQADGLTTPEHAGDIATAIAGAELHLLADAGHMLTWEAAPAVNALLRSWLGA